MTCIPIKDGILCMDDGPIDLLPYGAHVWMTWHPYCGPTFYRSENCIKAIEAPSKKTWDAFGKWHNEQ